MNRHINIINPDGFKWVTDRSDKMYLDGQGPAETTIYIGNECVKKALDEIDPSTNNELQMLLKTGQLCSTAVITQNPNDESSWKVLGDPTEGALLIAAEKAGINSETTRSDYEEITEISFDSKRKRMTTIYRDEGGEYWAFTKGAPEVILERSSGVQSPTPS